MEKTFEDWKAEVDQFVERMTGLSSDDLPDVCYRDMFDDDMKPASAARRAIRNAME